MRLNEFIQSLLEYKREITQSKMGDKLVAAAQRDRKQDIDTILTSLEEMDPTKNKQYTEWLCRQYIAGQFRLEDRSRINDVLVKFENAKRRMQQRDINKYTFRSLEDEIDKIYNVELNTGEGQNADVNIPDIKILYNGPLGFLAVPETKEASKALGRGTKWCTAAEKDNRFDYYNDQGELYVWKDKSGKKYQFHFGEELQFMDDKDKPIDHPTLEYFRKSHPVLSTLFKSKEGYIATLPYSAVAYARDVIGGRWPEAEEYIVEDPCSAYMYADQVINGRWPEAENLLAGDAESAVNYAANVIGGRWPEAEKTIASNPYNAYRYAIDVIGGRWPDAEPLIARNSRVAVDYARDVIKGRWPAAEKTIASDPGVARLYNNMLAKL